MVTVMLVSLEATQWTYAGRVVDWIVPPPGSREPARS
jgi:hypothetical protein